MNAKVFTNENFVALPKYNFGAKSQTRKDYSIIIDMWT